MTPFALFACAILTSLGLAVAAVMRSPRGLLRWSFAAGMSGFAVEAAAAYILTAQCDTPDERLLWLRTVEIIGLALLVPWMLFVVALTRPVGPRPSQAFRVGLGATALAIVGSIVAVAYLPMFLITDVTGPFYAARFDTAGWLVVSAQLIATVVLVAGLEAALRASRRDERWRVKYLVLGLGGIFLVRFYFLSQVALFRVFMASYMITGAATLFIGNVVIGASLGRDRLRTQLSVSRHVLYRLMTVGVLGIYLLAVGILGWLLNRLGIGEELFLWSVIIFISALAVAALLLSEAVRWRAKRFVARNFYRSKYDYREQWVSFTKRLGSLVTTEALAPQLIGAVVEAVGAKQGILYLKDARDGFQRPVSAAGMWTPMQPLGENHALIELINTRRRPLVFEERSAEDWLEAPLVSLFSKGTVVVPLRWRTEVTGFLLVGPERTGAVYSSEDLEFLEVLGEQAAGVIVTVQMSERVAQSREFEAFHRLTSFVIHDIKNSISALSMLSENAIRHFDDPEFQRDVVKTVAKSVDRMRVLLGRLSSAPEAAGLHLETVDLAGLVRDAAASVAPNDRISLVMDLAPLPPVRADADALLRVVQNLVTNAVQSIEGQGIVTLRTAAQDRHAVLSVADTGCGMSEEFLRGSLFSPFQTTMQGGWGIGLYQAKSIVEAHGGRIDVSSQVGSGTTFRVSLPLSSGDKVERDASTDGLDDTKGKTAWIAGKLSARS